MNPRRRLLLAALPHLVAVAPAVVLLTTAGERLPDPIASHFGASGRADGFSAAGAGALVMVALGIGLALLFGTSARFATGSPAPALSRWDLGRWFIGVSWGAAAFLGVMLWAAARANLDLPDARAAVLPGTIFLVALLAAAGAGLLGGLLAPRTPRQDTEPAQVPPVAIGATEQVSWSRSVGSRWLPIGGGLLGAAGVVLAVQVQPVAGAGVVVAGLTGLLLGGARVIVDRRGLTVALGLLGWPRILVPAEDITEVAVADVSPAHFGGWGYRIVPGGRGVIIRSGPALVVTRRSGQRLTVTVDDPETAAGLLTAVAPRTG